MSCNDNLVVIDVYLHVLVQLTCLLPLAVYLTHILDPIQGDRGTIKIMLVSAVGAGLGTFLSVAIAYYIIAVMLNGSSMVDTMAASLLYRKICGFHGVLSGLLVALKQAIPENEVTILTSIRLKVKQIPSIYIGVSCMGALVMGVGIKVIPFVLWGGFAAWFYLRYFHRAPESGLQGDPSEQFAFSTFFPENIQPFVSAVAGTCYVAFKVAEWTPQQRSVLSAAEDGDMLPSSMDAVRRRCVICL